MIVLNCGNHYPKEVENIMLLAKRCCCTDVADTACITYPDLGLVYFLIFDQPNGVLLTHAQVCGHNNGVEYDGNEFIYGKVFLVNSCS
jgi:hypothetical protein